MRVESKVEDNEKKRKGLEQGRGETSSVGSLLTFM